MSNYIYDEYYIDIPYENVINSSLNAFNNLINLLQDNNQSINTNNSNINLSSNTPQAIPTPSHDNLWIPNETFWHIYNKFQSTILKKYPDTPCVYCNRLLYKDKVTWITYDSSQVYPIEQVNQIDVVTLYSISRQQIIKIPSCSSYAKSQSRFQFPRLAKIPNEIEAVPLHQRKFLSPVYLHCSLRRNSDSNSYSEYHSIVRTMGYSINFRALALYSGIMGAYLQPINSNHIPNEEILNNTLLQG